VLPETAVDGAKAPPTVAFDGAIEAPQFRSDIRRMETTAEKSWPRNIAYAALAIGAAAGTSILGQIATYPNLAPWYAGLAKPSFNPPNWVFAPVWTSLYVLMAFALWRVLRVRGGSEERRWAIVLFFAQLVLNAGWSWMFFGARSPALGLVNIIPQFFVVIATILAFWQVDRIAAFCLVPLAAWVGFASALNASIWWLNS
jgi:tryptophan-rich sensory protein